MAGEPVYFAFSSGEQLGPMSLAELQALASNGTLKPSDLVWKSGTPEWVPASSFLSFAPEPPDEPPREPPPLLPPPPLRAASSASAPETASPKPAPSLPPAGAAALARARSLVDDIRSFSFSELVPYSRLLDPETLGAPAAWVLLLFGLGPLVLGTLVEDPIVRVRLFNFGCGALWTAFFVAAFKTEKQSLRLGIAAFFATGIFGVLFVTVLQGVPPLSWLYGLLSPRNSFLVRFVAYTGGVAVLEEIGKALLLLLLAKKMGGLDDPADGVFYGLMSGLGFGVYEAIAYTEWVNPRSAAAITFETGSLNVGLYAYFVANVVRIVSLPLLHAVWTAIVGYFIGLSFAATKKTTAVMTVGLLIAVVLHGAYDAFLSERAGLFAVVVAAVSLLLFLAYRRSADRILAEIRRADRE